MAENPILEFLEKQRAEHAARVKAHEELVASKKYQDELKFIDRMTLDFLKLLKLCSFYSTRAGKYSENSLVIQNTGDLAQSVIAVSALVRDGLINPVKRELRYVIESSVKHLYVDQEMDQRNPYPTLGERLDFLQANVDSSIDVRDKLKLEAFQADGGKQFIAELYDAYRDCCAYVHVSKRQIEERLELAEQGRAFGFETEEELREIGRLMFRVYDIALALYFHGFGLSMTGDVFVQGLDDLPAWKFHKGKYVKLISASFDYKDERKSKKDDDSRPSWPPKPP